MTHGSGGHAADSWERAIARAQTLQDLAGLLRALRRRHARRSQDSELTYRELAALTGWSQTAIAEYVTGKTLPPTDRFDALVAVFGATPTEQRALATVRDRIEERRRRSAGQTAPDPRSHPSAQSVPRQLPAAARRFVGRTAELDTLTRLMDEPPTAGTVVISAISGTAGIGKTALAVHWGHRVADRFPDGQLYLNLRGFEPGRALDPADAIRGFLAALGVSPRRIPVGLDAQAGLYRSVLAGRRMLILLDNARDTGQVRPLLPGSPGCLVLVTSRNQLTSLVAAEGAHPLVLGLFTTEEARDLLAHRLGPDRLAAEPEAVDEIVNHCARLPLALTITAARAATHSNMSLRALATQLRDAQGRLDVLTGDHPSTDLRATFSWSYRTLTAEAARLFRLLALHPGPIVAAAVAASLAGLPIAAVQAPLAELTRAHLIIEPAFGRYTFHDLLRVYAIELANAIDADHDRRAAVHRMLDHYLHTAHAAALLLNPQRSAIDLSPAQPGVTIENLDSAEGALAWFDTEHSALLHSVNLARRHGFSAHAWQLARTLPVYLNRRGRWDDLAWTQHQALRAARDAADGEAQAHASRYLGRAYTQLDRYDEAEQNLSRALDLYRLAGDHIGQARTHHDLAWLLERRGRHRDSLWHDQQALGLFRTAGHQGGQADALNSVGWDHALLGEHAQALAHCEEALALQTALANPHGQATAWDSLGYIHHHLGDHHQAVVCYRHALDLYRGLGDRYQEASTLRRLGDSHETGGAPDAARLAWQQALTILEGLGHTSAGQVREKLATLDRPSLTIPLA